MAKAGEYLRKEQHPVNLIVTPEAHEDIAKAAALAGDGSMASFARRVVSQAAASVLRKRGLRPAQDGAERPRKKKQSA